jgi:hypothetical protein
MVLSLILFAATVTLWVRGYQTSETIGVHIGPANGSDTSFRVESGHGT